MTEYRIDIVGRLWKGPVCPDENLHWATLEGQQADGSPCWVVRRSERPPGSSRIPAEQAIKLIHGA